MQPISQSQIDRSYLSVDWRQPVNWDHKLNEGLVAWYLVTHDRSWSNILRDLVRPASQNMTGVNTENTDWSSGIGYERPGGWGCIDLGGTDEHYQLGTPLVTGYPAHVSCWARLADVTSQFDLVVINKTIVFDNYFVLFADGAAAGDPVQCISQSTTSERIASTTTGYTANTWFQGSMALRSATSRDVYINGGSKGSNTASDTPTTLEQTTIGAYVVSGSEFGPVTGQIDCVRIYNRALSDDEVCEEYELTSRYSVGLLNRRRRVKYFVPAAPPGGTILPQLMQHGLYAGGVL